METTPPQVLAVLIVVVAAIRGSSVAIPLSVDTTQTNAQQFTSEKFLPAEMTMSMVVNQMALLRLLNDSSVTCSLLESSRETLRDVKHQLNATEQVLLELQDAREAAMHEFNEKHEHAQEELRDLKDAAKAEMHTWNEETKQRLHQLKESAVTELNQKMQGAIERLQENTDAAMEHVNEKKRNVETEIATLRESAIDDMTTAKQEAQHEINEAREQSLAKLKEARKTIKIFRVFRGSVTQSEAMDACEGMGGRIAVPENKQEDDEVSWLVKRDRPGEKQKRYRIGVNDREEEGVWVDGNTGLRVSYTNFGDEEPNNYGGNEDCVSVEPTEVGWNDLGCFGKAQGYLCQFSIAVV